jgi:hypothetical protein
MRQRTAPRSSDRRVPTLALLLPLASVACAVLASAACSSSSDDGDGEDSGTSSGAASGGSSSGTNSGSTSGAGSSDAGSNSGSSSGASSGAGSSDAGTKMDATATAGGDGGLVLDTDGGSCPAPAGITSQQMTALQIINQTRAAMGSPCATDVATLNTSATKHCAYYAANVSSATCEAMGAHVEISGCPDYVASDFGTRESTAGYKCTPSTTQSCGASEVMAFNDNPTAALAQWIGSIYHRTPLLDPRTRDFGYGNATGCDTIDLGEGAGSTTPADVIVSYPYDGMTGVGRSFAGNQEEPTPPVPPSGWPSALPVTIFMLATSVTLTTDEFGIDGGAQLAHQVMTPQSAMGYLENALVLYGNAPLAAKTTYRVHVAGTRQVQGFRGAATSANFDVSFSFTTQ